MEPVSLTLAGVGAVALTEGIKFLYAQAGEVLKRWWDRKERGEAAAAVPVEVTLPPAFAGQLKDTTADLSVVARKAARLEELFESLSLYAAGAKAIVPTDTQLLEKVDALRDVLEDVYGQHLTLIGEARPATGSPLVRGAVDAKIVRGEAAGVVTDTVKGTIEGRGHAEEVTETGGLYGVVIRSKTP